MPIGSGGGGGFKLGPTQNIFDAGTGGLSAAEALRDSYASSNPSWLAEYDDNEDLNILLLYTDGGQPSAVYNVRGGGDWRTNTSTKGLRGPKGDTGDDGDPTTLIDDSASSTVTTYSSDKIDKTFPKINDSAESDSEVFSSEKTKELIDAATPSYSGQPNEIMKLDANGDLVPSGVMSNKDGSISLSSGSADIGPHTLSSTVEGVEATNESTGESFSFVFAGQGDDCGPVDRLFGDESLIKTTDDLSLQLTNHASKLTATADIRIIKKPILIKPVAPQTNVTMQITDLNSSDLWTYGPFDITVDANGNFEFTISSIIDFKVGEYLVTFLSPDGDVTLYGGLSPISGEQIVYGELPFKPFHDETLHNIKSQDKIVREIDVDPDSGLSIAVDGNGKLVIGNIPSDPETVDIAFWWSDNAEPTDDDILNAMSQTQTPSVISHTDNFTREDLQNRTMTAKRDESSFKYAFFAWQSGFFSPEPTKVDTGFGGPSTWKQTAIIVDGVTYNILTVEVKNNSTSLEDYALIQEGIR